MKASRYGILLGLLFLTGCLTHAAYFAITPYNEDQWRNEYAKKDFTLSSGIHLKYHDVGPKEGKTLVLIHGMGDSSRAWYLIGPELLKTYRLIAPDLPGHGLSEVPACCYKIENYEKDIAELLDSLKIDKAVFVGHSMGAFIAQRFAADYPARVEKLILISSSDSAAGNKELDYVAGAAQTSRGTQNSKFTDHWWTITTVMPVPESLASKAKNERENIPKDVWNADVKIMMDQNQKPDLAKINVPTLILWGEKDKIFSKADQDRLHSEIAHSEFKEYAGAGHTVQWEMPAEVTADIKAFVGA